MSTHSEVENQDGWASSLQSVVNTLFRLKIMITSVREVFLVAILTAIVNSVSV